MADRLPSFGTPPRDASKPKRMLYQQNSWTLPAAPINVSQQEWDRIFGERETTALTPDHEKSVASRARNKSLAASIAARYGETIEKD